MKRLLSLVVAALFLYIGGLLNQMQSNYIQDIVLQCGIATILAVSLNLVNGLTGQFSIGHAGFMSVGAYAGASVTYLAFERYTGHRPPGIAWMLLAMLAGGVCAAAAGYLVGVPSLRLRGDYLAIVTLGFGEIIRVLLENATSISPKLNYTGGAIGFSGDSGSYSVPHLSSFGLVYAAALGVIVLSRNLKFSSHGLAFMSVREDEVAADAMGVNTTRVKVSAFVLSAFLAGVGGTLFAHALFFQPKTFGFIASMNYVVMVVLGGSGSITGATLAAVILTALPEYLKSVQDKIHFQDEYRLVVYALVLVLMMILRPSGVFGAGELSLSGLFRKLIRGTGGTTEEVEAPDLSAVPASAASPVAAQETVLRTSGLTRKFGGLTAVGDINLRVGKGELVGLIGPNGAGKTTFFNLLTGVYEPSEGRLEFSGDLLAGERPYPPARRLALLAMDVALASLGAGIIATIIATAVVPAEDGAATQSLLTGIQIAGVLLGGGASLATAPRRRRYLPGLKPFQFAERGISRTFQNIRLFGNLTVLDNVRIGAYLRRKTGLLDALLQTHRLRNEEQEIVAQARQLLRRFNLLRFENELAKNLPYGEQRRLEIVRALATKPHLLLLDEPAAGMNPQEKTQLMGLIREIRDDFGLTILLIEHDMKLVMGICERIYVLDYGQVIAEGTADQICRDPRVIAAYLGEEFGGENADAKADDTLATGSATGSA